MKADFEAAALKATETMLKHRVSFAPVAPLPILNTIPGVIVVSFAEMAETMGVDRSHVIGRLITENHDAVTAYNEINGKPHYIVAYNQRLPFYMLQRSLARELGHIVMAHDGSRPEDVRTEEAVFFARHFICPRPLIRALQESGVKITVELIGNITGCYERCLNGIRATPGAHVPAELNRLVRDQFEDYVANLIDYLPILSADDHSAEADLGTFMDNYED